MATLGISDFCFELDPKFGYATILVRSYRKGIILRLA